MLKEALVVARYIIMVTLSGNEAPFERKHQNLHDPVSLVTPLSGGALIPQSSLFFNGEGGARFFRGIMPS